MEFEFDDRALTRAPEEISAEICAKPTRSKIGGFPPSRGRSGADAPGVASRSGQARDPTTGLFRRK